MKDVLIIGCGYVGERVAALWQEQGACVSALARSHQRAAELEQRNIAPVAGDLDAPGSLTGLPLEDRLVYYFAPPPDQGTGDSRMERFCRVALARQQPWKIIYISTSGVYGDCAGARVNEDAPLAPRTDRAKRRVAAEETLRRWAREKSETVVVLRVPGIYGPGRLPIARLEKNMPVLDKAQAPPSNRIHVLDLARICVAAGERGEAGEVFNVSDDSGGSMTDYFNAVADACGLPRPPQISMDEARRVLSPTLLSYLDESRRLDTARLREKLGIHLVYPDLESGLRASIDEGTSKGER